MEQALDVQRQIGVGIGIPYWSAKLAAAHALNGNDATARKLLADSIGRSKVRTEGAWLAERLRLAGDVHACGGRKKEARLHYETALKTAAAQGANLWERRARQALAAL